MNNLLEQVAERLHELRRIFGYTEADIAEKISVTEEAYKEYEKAGADIPVSVVYKLANVYKVDMTEILSGKSPKLNTVSVVRKSEGIKVERFEGYEYENIAYKFAHRIMEPMIVTLHPQAELPDLVTHAGQEINYCLEGEMTLIYNGVEIHLNAGDCAYFDATNPHGQTAASGGIVKFLTVIKE